MVMAAFDLAILDLILYTVQPVSIFGFSGADLADGPADLTDFACSEYSTELIIMVTTLSFDRHRRVPAIVASYIQPKFRAYMNLPLHFPLDPPLNRIKQ